MRWILIVGIGFASMPIFAAESQFGFIYTTDLLPKGAKEFEQWITWRNQKISGNFDLLEGRTAFEYGAGDDYQVSLYATYAWTQAYHNGPGGATTPPEQFAYDLPGIDDHYNTTRYIGTSVEVIYRMLSPYTDSIGLAIYMEPTLGEGFLELENKLILQKNYFDDTLTIAFNFTYAPEFRLLSESLGAPQAWQEETDVNFDIGASYRFAANWWYGVEFVNEQERNSLNFTDQTNGGYYVGPNLHYGGKDYFWTILALTQMPWATGHVATTPGAVVNGYDFDNDFEKYRVRFKFGFYF